MLSSLYDAFMNYLGDAFAIQLQGIYLYTSARLYKGSADDARSFLKARQRLLQIQRDKLRDSMPGLIQALGSRTTPDFPIVFESDSGLVLYADPPDLPTEQLAFLRTGHLGNTDEQWWLVQGQDGPLLGYALRQQTHGEYFVRSGDAFRVSEDSHGVVIWNVFPFKRSGNWYYYIRNKEEQYLGRHDVAGVGLVDKKEDTGVTWSIGKA